MRALILLPLLAFAGACSDGSPFQPEATVPPDAGQPEPTVSAMQALSPRWEVEFTLSFLRTVEPGEAAVNAGGILHGKGLVNEFNLTGVMRRGGVEGEMAGLQYFMGDYVINQNKTTGRTRARPALFVISESPLGAGTWACQGTYKAEPREGWGLVQFGEIAGCQGTGAFEGMRMKLYGTNDTPTPFLFNMWGEIW